ncbi:MAG: DUF1353 domain-containing protein [Gammaproteobacteria bacterium]|nr:DUF1353 domain-containing protein [Gammaproteobacteria bacterium]
MYDQPDIRPQSESGDLYVLQDDFVYTGNGEFITVPEGFKYDGASTPKFLWWVLPRDGIHRAAALIHDFIYVFEGKMPDGQIFTRKAADKLFYNIMVDYGVASWRAKIAHRAVRIVGYFYWRE